MRLNDIGVHNNGARVVSILTFIAERVSDQRRKVRAVNDFGNGDAARLALLSAAVGEVSHTFLYGNGPLEDAVAGVQVVTQEWLESLMSEAAA